MEKLSGYYSLKGFRLRLWMWLTFLVGRILPKGYHFETNLIHESVEQLTISIPEERS